MKFFYIFSFVFFSSSIFSQSDFDYKFSTNGYALLPVVDTLIELQMIVNIEKRLDELVIYSNSGTSSVKYRAIVSFMGLKHNRQMSYISAGIGDFIFIDPIAGVVLIRNEEGQIIAKYGSSHLFEYW